MKLTNKQLKLLKQCFEKEPLIKLAYLFGSQATGDTGPLSDYDFAIYADTRDNKKSFYLKCHINSCICGILNTDKVDVVMLGSSTRPLIKYMAISEGIVISFSLHEYIKPHNKTHNITNIFIIIYIINNTTLEFLLLNQGV